MRIAVSQAFYFILEVKLPALQFRNFEGIRRRPSLFFIDFAIQSAVFFCQFIEMRFQRHTGPPD